MKQATKNPVLNIKDAKAIEETFISVLPEVPTSVLSPQGVVDAQKANEEDGNKTEIDKLKTRAKLAKRNALLLDREITGWYDFGVPTAEMKIEASPSGLQIVLKNHRNEVTTCKLYEKNDKGWSNMYLAQDLTTAFKIGKVLNANVHVYTSTRGDGKWKANEWFDQIYVTYTPKKESK